MSNHCLCTECCEWTVPDAGMCRQCGRALPAAPPDATRAGLARRAGELRQRLGEVEFRSRGVRTRGLLYATTTGLLFLPHRLERGTRSAHAHSPWLYLAMLSVAVVLGPWALLLPHLAPRRRRLVSVRTWRPRFLDPLHAQPAQMLVDCPHSWLLTPGHVCRVQRQGNAWQLLRVDGATIRLRGLADARHLDRELNQLLEDGPWRHAVSPA